MNFTHTKTLELDQDFWNTFAVSHGLFLPYLIFFSLIFNPQYMFDFRIRLFHILIHLNISWLNLRSDGMLDC